MALDGITLNYLKNEFTSEAVGLRVNKIYNPTREEIVLVLGGKKSMQLFLSASSSSPRIHFTEEKFENPLSPPMFCMLLRKHLQSSRIRGFRQEDLDRILYVDFATRDNLGDEIILTLAIEIMGRHSNIILIGPDGNVIDSIKRIGLETSSVRQILPGIRFDLPPSQDKISILENEPSEIINRLKKSEDGKTSKRLLEVAMGFSPILARELSFKSVFDVNKLMSSFTEEDFLNLEKEIMLTKKHLLSDKSQPTIVFDENKKPKDFSILKINQYGDRYKTKSFKSISETIEFFYKEKYRIERVKSRSSDILKILKNNIDRTTKKILKQENELLESEKGVEFQKYGDLISANMYSIKKGDHVAKIIDYYDDNQKTIEINIDYKLSPAKNAQMYYKKYKKAEIAKEKLTVLIEDGKNEKKYLESVLESVLRTDNEHELELIKEELIEQKYIRESKARKGSFRKINVYNEYMSTSEIDIVAGKNNKANDLLTLKTAANDDLWFHVQNMPGSHVVIRKKGKIIDNETIIQAAKIAVYHSKARDGSNIPVDYTEIKNVRRQKGGKPGMVVYNNFKTVFVTPHEDEIIKLAIL